MEIKQLIISYWRDDVSDKIPQYKDGDIYPYSAELREEIIDNLLSVGLKVMLHNYPEKNKLIIFIDKGRFSL